MLRRGGVPPVVMESRLRSEVILGRTRMLEETAFADSFSSVCVDEQLIGLFYSTLSIQNVSLEKN